MFHNRRQKPSTTGRRRKVRVGTDANTEADGKESSCVGDQLVTSISDSDVSQIPSKPRKTVICSHTDSADGIMRAIAGVSYQVLRR